MTEFKPGIYFDLPEDQYHADPAFSASGAKNILASPLDYWVRSPLNPDRPDGDSAAKERGKAFHARILEGPEIFAERYATKPNPDAYPGVIMDGPGLQERCGELGLKKSGKNIERCERILEVDASANLWPKIMDDFNRENEGKMIISRDLADDIERQARIVEMHESARKAFTGGYSEVSLFWIDDETGVRMKARIDHLKVRAAVDLKTFSNMYGMPLDQAVARAVANYRYHVQAVFYTDGVEVVKAMYRDKGFNCVHDGPPKKWLDAFANADPHAFVFVFLEAGHVPNVVAREFRATESGAQPGATHNLYWQSGWAGYRQAVQRYKQCLEQYGPDVPWVDAQPMRPFIDEEFPAYAFD